jgi:mRNA interferase HigB
MAEGEVCLKNKSLPFVNFLLSLAYNKEMRVNLIKKQVIEDYVATHARSRTSFEFWLAMLKAADWERKEDIKGTFGSVDFLGKSSGRIIFNIGGNDFRMICSYFFGRKRVRLFIC